VNRVRMSAGGRARAATDGLIVVCEFTNCDPGPRTAADGLHELRTNVSQQSQVTACAPAAAGGITVLAVRLRRAHTHGRVAANRVMLPPPFSLPWS
jgi:hypothetical protein